MHCNDDSVTTLHALAAYLQSNQLILLILVLVVRPAWVALVCTNLSVDWQCTVQNFCRSKCGSQMYTG
jgi:hypothetical protein